MANQHDHAPYFPTRLVSKDDYGNQYKNLMFVQCSWVQ